MSLRVEKSDAFSEIDDESRAESVGSTRKSEIETDKYGFVGGKEYTDPENEKISVEKVRKSETKWLDMLDNWDRWMDRKFSKVKKRCRKGIPSSLRGRAWQLLSGSKYKQAKNRDVFEQLLKAEAKPQIVEDINKDLHRQFPFHEMFAQKGGSGQQDLRDILHAYAIYNPRDGYCQAHGPIAAVLLMHMPAEEAFWCMVAVFECYIPGYFSPGLEAVQVDGDVMQGLLRHVSPTAYKHLDLYQVTPMLYCTEWFMCIFSRTLPWPCVLRLWDMFFCEGIKVVFRCALAIVKNALGKAETLQLLPGMYETLNYLKHFDLKQMEPDVLMTQVVEIKISEEDLEKEHERQLKMRRKLNAQSPSIERSYKLRYVHDKKASETYNSFKSQKRLSAISVNMPLIMEQALEIERSKKKGVKEPRMRYKKSLLHPSDYNRRHSDTFVIANNAASSHRLSKLTVLTAGTSSLSIPDMAVNQKKF